MIHQFTSVSKSLFLPTEQSRQCQMYATTVKNDLRLMKCIKLEDRISSKTGTFWHSQKVVGSPSPDDTDSKNNNCASTLFFCLFFKLELS